MTLDKKFIKQQKKKIKKEKKALEKELKKIADEDIKPKGDYDTRMPQFGKHKDEESLEFTLYDSRLPVEHNLELRLAKVNRSLDRIQKDDYGICINCNKPIKRARLEIVPETETCMKCKK